MHVEAIAYYNFQNWLVMLLKNTFKMHINTFYYFKYGLEILG